MRLAADYLSIPPPFEPRFAERVVAEKSSDTLLRLFFVIGEVARSTIVSVFWTPVAFLIRLNCRVTEVGLKVVGQKNLAQFIGEVRKGFGPKRPYIKLE